MSEESQNQNENKLQKSSGNQTVASSENTPPKLQAVEPTPKPEPSYGSIDFSEDSPSLTFEQYVEPSPKPNPSFETHLKEAPRKSSKTVEKRNEID